MISALTPPPPLSPPSPPFRYTNNQQLRADRTHVKLSKAERTEQNAPPTLDDWYATLRINQASLRGDAGFNDPLRTASDAGVEETARALGKIAAIAAAKSARTSATKRASFVAEQIEIERLLSAKAAGPAPPLFDAFLSMATSLDGAEDVAIASTQGDAAAAK